MKVELDTLLDELARRHARGEPLDVEGTLAKAGDRADELAPLIEAFLLRAPRRAPSDESLAYVRSLDDPPMTRARVAKALKRRRRRRRDRQGVRGPTGGPPEGAPLLPAARRRHPRPVALSRRPCGTRSPALLGRPRWTLITPRIDTMQLRAKPMYRADKLFDPSELPSRSASTSEPDPPDEVDALFLGDPS